MTLELSICVAQLNYGFMNLTLKSTVLVFSFNKKVIPQFENIQVTYCDPLLCKMCYSIWQFCVMGF